MTLPVSQMEQAAPVKQSEFITLEKLNSLFKKGNEVLDRLEHQVVAVSAKDDKEWTPRFTAVKASMITPDTTIGVIGMTGAGKSAMLNALLDKQVLVPTSCMQACTATVIEVAWNHSDEHPIRAEVYFATTESWQEDIRVSLKDAISDSQSLRDETTEAGVAYRKITAVYPFIDTQNIKSTTVDELMQVEYIQGHLGQVIDLDAPSAEDMHHALSKYVEAKVRSTDEEEEDEDTDEQDSTPPMHDTPIEFWPLVQKVRIYLKSPILETGVVIADLPGVGDTNASRGGIAQGHLLQCANIWIVTPIARAVDDQVARNLLGQSFRRQVRRDGIMSRIAFVCSKSDELVVSELKDKLPRKGDYTKALKTIRSERKDFSDAHQRNLDELQLTREQIKSVDSRLADIPREKTDYIRLGKLAKLGAVVHPPAPWRSKRVAIEQQPSTVRLIKIEDDDLELLSLASDPDSGTEETDSIEASKAIESSSEDVEQDITQTRLSFEDIARKIVELREEDVRLRTRKQELCNQRKGYKADIQQYTTETRKFADREWDAHLRARNDYCRRRIREDFLNGIRELQKDEMQLDDETHDPEAEVDGSAILPTQLDLPVFCISSQGFQKVSGRLQKERIANKFRSLEQTGIPELAAHCRKLGERDLLSRYEAYSDLASQLVTSLRVRFFNPFNTVPDTTDNMQETTDNMLAETSSLVQVAFTDLEDLVGRVVKTLEEGAQIAEDKAIPVVNEWTNTEGNALRYMTYRAVVRRGGTFNKPHRSLDFARDLLEPLLTYIDGVWNKIFNERIPKRLADLQGALQKMMSAYLSDLDSNSEFAAATSKVADIYLRQVSIFRAELDRSVDNLAQTIQTLRQNVNRLFAKNIREEIQAICTVLDTDKGKGVFARIKNGMREGIDKRRKRIFKQSAKTVEKTLDSGLKRTRSHFMVGLDNACVETRRDCHELFERKMHGGEVVPAIHKASILQIIEEAEQIFDKTIFLPEDVVKHADHSADLKHQVVDLTQESQESGSKIGSEKKTRTTMPEDGADTCGMGEVEMTEEEE